MRGLEWGGRVHGRRAEVVAVCVQGGSLKSGYRYVSWWFSENREQFFQRRNWAKAQGSAHCLTDNTATTIDIIRRMIEHI